MNQRAFEAVRKMIYKHLGVREVFNIREQIDKIARSIADAVSENGNKIKQLTQVIRNHAECELDLGTLRTLKMIDDEADACIETILKNWEGKG